MRTDIHRPSAIKPEEYEFVAFNYIGGSDLGAILALKAQKEIFWAHMKQTGGKFSGHEHGGTCFVCGAFACYLCIWYHAPTNAYIETGEDCARKMDMAFGDMNPFRRAIADAREAQAGKRKAIAILSDLSLMTAWEIYTAPWPQHSSECRINQNGGCTCEAAPTWKTLNAWEETTIRDIVGKLVKYGNVSDKQVEFLRKLLNRIMQRPIIEAQRQTEHDAAGPVPVGRIEMSGEVIGVKEVEGQPFSYHDDGIRTKLIIKLENGSKVYGNRFENLSRGDKVKFVATVEASKDDPKFGYYKRPRIVAHVEAVQS